MLNQHFIFNCNSLRITSELKEIVYYIKRPIDLFFYALSNKTIIIFVAKTSSATYLILHTKVNSDIQQEWKQSVFASSVKFMKSVKFAIH